MFFLWRFGSVVLLLILGLNLTNAGAQPQLPNYAPVVEGRVTYLAAGETERAMPVDAALVEVFFKNALVFQTQTDDEGAFALDRLPVPASERDGFIVVARPDKSHAELAPVATAFVLSGNGETPLLQLAMQPEAARVIRVVKFADGAPLQGATVKATGFAVALPQSGGSWKLPFSGVRPQRSDANGEVVLQGLPTGALIELTAQHEEYADTIVRFLRNESSKTIALSLESVVFGTVTLGGEPLDVPQWMVKMQGWDEPWRQNWRTGNLNARGEYVIENLSVPQLIGHATYPINLELNRVFDPRPGLHADYVPPSGGWDVMVTAQRDGQTQRWITYIAGPSNGLKFAENSDVRHDIALEPMALIVGETAPGATVSYRNPRSLYGNWRQQAGADGHFEIPVPTGDVELTVDGKIFSVKELQAHETRELN